MKAVFLILGICGVLLSAARAVDPVVVERPLMGTLFKVVVFPGEGADPKNVDAAIDEAFALALKIDEVASDYKKDNELARLNAHGGGESSPTLKPIIAESVRLSKRTEGAYDPGLGRMTRLWRGSVKSKLLPDAKALEKAHAMNWSWQPDEQTIVLSGDRGSGACLDLGGIAKGYAADQMYDHLKAAGYLCAAIVAGGDVRVGIAPPNQAGWPVTIRTAHPDQSDLTILAVNAGVSTSGALYQKVVIDGVTYSHILDPKTGLGLTTPIAATVIAPNATLSDALATAACVVGPERAVQVHKDWGATSVRVVTDEGVAIPDGDGELWRNAK